MADFKDNPKTGRIENVLHHDEGDGTFSQANAAHLRGWDTTDTIWSRILVEHASGALQVAVAGSGWSPYLVDALTSTVTVSSSTGKFGGVVVLNVNSAPAYIQVFDTTGAVSLGTTVPTFVIPIPANATPANGAGIVMLGDIGVAISNGIKIAATTTPKGSSTVSTGLNGTLLYR